MRLNPLTVKRFRRFKSIRRGYVSLIILVAMIGVSLFAEVFVNSRALLVHYNGRYIFPVLGEMIPGSEFGLDYNYETDYRQLRKIFAAEQGNNWLLMPVVPYNPYENDFIENSYPPFPPSFSRRHYLGTDTVGRDIAARLIYGFRIAILFSLILLLVNYSIGISIGGLMGFFGGWFDLFFQRVIEIWSNVPLLYVIIIISSIVVPSFFMLIIIMAFFGWIGITWMIRTMVYKEKEREYVLAARAMGASGFRLLFRHILPNTLSVVVTFAPFAVSGGIVSLTSLDYLGFGLAPPTPSWGELLQQGWANMDAWWIVSSVVAAMIITLTAVTFVGEGVREAFDPKKHTIYE